MAGVALNTNCLTSASTPSNSLDMARAVEAVRGFGNVKIMSPLLPQHYSL
jgi:hypothetical protein